MYNSKTNMKKLLFGTKKQKIISVTLLVLLLVGGCYAFYRTQIYEPSNPTTADGKPVNLEPATEEDKQDNDQTKEAAVKQAELEKQQPANSAGKKSATIVITQASSTGVRAYISNVFEDNGTCAATAVLGSQSQSKSSTGFQNVSYTQCAPIDWDTPLSPGTWTITLRYDSASAQGSQTQTLEVK